MLDFQINEPDYKLKYFTNIEWIKEIFKHRSLEFLTEPSGCDVCIVDKNYDFTEEDFKDSLKINVDKLSSDVGVILFVSIKDLNRLSTISNALQSIYPNMETVIMTPAKRLTYKDNCAELFVFKN